MARLKSGLDRACYGQLSLKLVSGLLLACLLDLFECSTGLFKCELLSKFSENNVNDVVLIVNERFAYILLYIGGGGGHKSF